MKQLRVNASGRPTRVHDVQETSTGICRLFGDKKRSTSVLLKLVAIDADWCSSKVYFTDDDICPEKKSDRWLYSPAR